MSDFPTVGITTQLNPNAPAEAGAALMDSFNLAWKKAAMANAQRKIATGDKAAGLAELAQYDPQLALQVGQQLRADKKDADADAATKAADARWLQDHPEDKAFIEQGGHAKDFNNYDYTQARTAKTNAQADASVYKTRYDAFTKAMSVVGAIRPNDPVSGAQAKRDAKLIFSGIQGMDAHIDSYPDAMTPEDIAQIQRETMSGREQIAAEARARGLDIAQQRADQTHEDRQAAIAQSNTNNIRTTETSAANNIRSTNQSNTNNVRSTEQSNTNSIRSSQTTQRGQDMRRGRHGGAPANRTIVRTGTDPATGRKVAKYSDGTTGYVD